MAFIRFLLLLVAGASLLLATATDVLAMLGRQFSLPLVGSIEMIQVLVLFAGSAAMLWATLDRTHARINIVLDRLPAPTQGWLQRLHDLAAALFFAALLAGSTWIGLDLLGGHEESEILRIPYLPLRVMVICLFAALLGLSLRRMLGKAGS